MRCFGQTEQMNKKVDLTQVKTRRERLKSALYLRLKKRKKNFKKIFFEYFFFQKMSHSAEKCKRGDPLGFINIYSVPKYQKTRKGDSFDTLKTFWKKSRTMPEKN